MGVNAVTKLVKVAAAKLGFNAHSHAFHSRFVIILVNELRVRTEKIFASARHNSVAVQHPYMACGTASEMAKFCALGWVKK